MMSCKVIRYIGRRRVVASGLLFSHGTVLSGLLLDSFLRAQVQAQAAEAAAAVEELKGLMSTREEELDVMTARAERASEATAQVGDSPCDSPCDSL